MSPVTHNLTAASLALVGAWFLRDTPAPMESAGLFTPWLPRSVPFVLGAMLGARAPDWLELAEFSAFFSRRISVIPHRTLTHWPWLWILALVVVVNLLPAYTEYPGREVIWGLLGFVSTGFLHILLDMMTPTGIPLGINPFGKRTAIAHVRTGSPAEILVSLSMWAIAIALVDVIKHAT